jgi:acetyl-CoA carboxylase biotin carboxyl carrier protein
MTLEEIRELIRLMKENGLSEIDIESAGERVRLRAAEPAPVAFAPPGVGVTWTVGADPPAAPVSSAASEAASTPEAPAEEDKGVVIKSPIVGMFYRAPASDKPPYVNVGDEIEENSVLCIIEAMKVMNEIKAEARGRLREILAESGQPVEFGQPLFIIDTP